MITALTRLRRSFRCTIGSMRHFTPRLIIATILAVSFAAIPATGLAAITGSKPPTPTACSTVGATCTTTGTADVSTAWIDNEFNSLVANAKTDPKQALADLTFASDLGKVVNSHFFALAAVGSTYDYSLPTITPSLPLPSATQVIAFAIGAFGASSPTTTALETYFTSHGYAVSYKVPPGNGNTSPSGGKQSPPTCGNILWVIPNLSCQVGEVVHFLDGMVAALTAPGSIWGDLFLFVSHLLDIPFAGSALLFNWLNMNSTVGQEMLNVYKVVVPVGLMLAVISAAARATKTIWEHKQGATVTFITEPIIRLVFVVALIAVFPMFISGIIPAINSSALALFNQLVAGGFSHVINRNGLIVGISQAVFTGPFMIVAILGIIAIFLAMLWITWLMIMRAATILLGTIFAPIIFGLAVYDSRLQPVQHWLKLYVGSLVSILVAALGLGATFGVTDVTLSTATDPMNATLALVFLIAGIILTGKMMTMAHGGTAGALGMMAVGGAAMGAISMVGGVAGGALAGAGVAAGSTIAQATSSFGSLLGAGAGGAMALGGAAPAAASLAMARMHGQPAPSGPLAHAPLQQQAGFAGHDEAVRTVFENDPTLHQAVVTATGHMSPNTPFEARMNEFSSNPVYKTVARRGMAGPHMAHIARGVDPTTIRTQFSPTAQHNLMESAHAAAAKMAAKVVPE